MHPDRIAVHGGAGRRKGLADHASWYRHKPSLQKSRSEPPRRWCGTQPHDNGFRKRASSPNGKPDQERSTLGLGARGHPPKPPLRKGDERGGSLSRRCERSSPIGGEEVRGSPLGVRGGALPRPRHVLNPIVRRFKNNPTRPGTTRFCRTNPARPATTRFCRTNPTRPAISRFCRTNPTRPATTGFCRTNPTRPATTGFCRTNPTRPATTRIRRTKAIYRLSVLSVQTAVENPGNPFFAKRSQFTRDAADRWRMV
jgi:hypothetical protein